jgi:hypothetical protein
MGNRAVQFARALFNVAAVDREVLAAALASLRLRG